MIRLLLGGCLITFGIATLPYLAHLSTDHPYTMHLAYAALMAVSLGTTLIISMIITK